MTLLHNDTFLRACFCEPTEYTPIWLMRQAGRYLPEYNATRSRAGNFLALCKNTELATEVTLQPLARFPLDAAILFSDILTVPDALGCGLYFAEGEGPRFERPLCTEADFKKLPPFDPHRLQYVFDAVSSIRRALAGSVPLIGFSGSPWTLACYMIEGQGSPGFPKTKALLYSRPDLVAHLLDQLADSVATYLNAQIDAGAQAIQIFDTWGGLLSAHHFATLSLATMQRVISLLKRHADGRKVPVIVFTKGGGQWLPELARSGADTLGIDWTTSPQSARAAVGSHIALQGNLDPLCLLGSEDVVCSEARRLVSEFGSQPGHIFNLGHGITPQTPPENVKALVETVHRESRKIRSLQAHAAAKSA